MKTKDESKSSCISDNLYNAIATQLLLLKEIISKVQVLRIQLARLLSISIPGFFDPNPCYLGESGNRGLAFYVADYLQSIQDT